MKKRRRASVHHCPARAALCSETFTLLGTEGCVKTVALTHHHAYMKALLFWPMRSEIGDGLGVSYHFSDLSLLSAGFQVYGQVASACILPLTPPSLCSHLETSRTRLSARREKNSITARNPRFQYPFLWAQREVIGGCQIEIDDGNLHDSQHVLTAGLWRPTIVNLPFKYTDVHAPYPRCYSR